MDSQTVLVLLYLGILALVAMSLWLAFGSRDGQRRIAHRLDAMDVVLVELRGVKRDRAVEHVLEPSAPRAPVTLALVPQPPPSGAHRIPFSRPMPDADDDDDRSTQVFSGPISVPRSAS